jgi:hypothetical protein
MNKNGGTTEADAFVPKLELHPNNNYFIWHRKYLISVSKRMPLGATCLKKGAHMDYALLVPTTQSSASAGTSTGLATSTTTTSSTESGGESAETRLLGYFLTEVRSQSKKSKSKLQVYFY